jgi:hypothetical protein
MAMHVGLNRSEVKRMVPAASENEILRHTP